MKDPKILLDYLVESIEQIESYVKGTSREQFGRNPQVQDAVLRRLEVIEEAVKSVPNTIKERHPSVPWRDIAGLRDVLIHAYFRVDLDLVWKTVREDIPKLKANILAILGELNTPT